MKNVAANHLKSLNRSTDHWWIVAIDWGYCGMVWRQEECTSGRRGEHWRLRKIYPACHSQTALTRAIRHDFPLAAPSTHALGQKSDGTERITRLAKLLCDYYHGTAQAMSFDRQLWSSWLPYLDLTGLSPFAQTVLCHVAAIPAGHTQTYGGIAARLGHPQAARAVGGALGKNPFPILVPCHRVIGKSGALTGFTAPGGIASKRRMIQHEAKLATAAAPLVYR